MAAFNVLVADAPVLPARNENVQRQRILFGSRFLQSGIDFSDGFFESVQSILEPVRPHCVQLNISGQFESSANAFESNLLP
jgi:hypothetical protein